jgi:hypothetical protein
VPEQIRPVLCQMYANPLLNAMRSKEQH